MLYSRAEAPPQCQEGVADAFDFVNDYILLTMINLIYLNLLGFYKAKNANKTKKAKNSNEIINFYYYRLSL